MPNNEQLLEKVERYETILKEIKLELERYYKGVKSIDIPNLIKGIDLKMKDKKYLQFKF